MHFTAHGPINAPVLLLVHGGGVAGWMWDRQVRRFAASHRVIVPDLPGHGASQTEPWTTTRAAAEALAAILKPRAGRAVTAVGFSLGGQVVLDLASRRPDLLSSLVVVSALTEPMRGAGAMGWLMGASAPLTRWRWFARKQARVLFIPDSQFEQYFATSTGLSRDTLAAVGRENYGFRIPAGWPGFDKPTLILAGSREPAMVLRGLRTLHAQRPGSALRIIEGAGHGVSLQFPERFNELLADWLDANG